MLATPRRSPGLEGSLGGLHANDCLPQVLQQGRGEFNDPLRKA